MDDTTSSNSAYLWRPRVSWLLCPQTELTGLVDGCFLGLANVGLEESLRALACIIACHAFHWLVVHQHKEWLKRIPTPGDTETLIPARVAAGISSRAGIYSRSARAAVKQLTTPAWVDTARS